MQIFSRYTFANFSNWKKWNCHWIFKKFHFDNTKTDAQILESLKAADSDSIDDMEAKLHIIKATHERLEKFRQLINRHYQKRGDRYNKLKAATLGIKVVELKKKTLDLTQPEELKLPCV